MDAFCTACGEALVGPFCTKCGKQSGPVARPTLRFSDKAALRGCVVGAVVSVLAWGYGYTARAADVFSIAPELAGLVIWLIAFGAWYEGEIRTAAARRVADGGAFTTR